MPITVLIAVDLTYSQQLMWLFMSIFHLMIFMANASKIKLVECESSKVMGFYKNPCLFQKSTELSRNKVYMTKTFCSFLVVVDVQPNLFFSLPQGIAFQL